MIPGEAKAEKGSKGYREQGLFDSIVGHYVVSIPCFYGFLSL